MSTQHTIVRELSPGSTLVYRVLDEADGELTQQQIIEEAMLHERTVRWALSQLEEEGLVQSRPNPHDARQQLYSLCIKG